MELLADTTVRTPKSVIELSVIVEIGYYLLACIRQWNQFNFFLQLVLNSNLNLTMRDKKDKEFTLIFTFNVNVLIPSMRKYFSKLREEKIIQPQQTNNL